MASQPHDMGDQSLLAIEDHQVRDHHPDAIMASRSFEADDQPLLENEDNGAFDHQQKAVSKDGVSNRIKGHLLALRYRDKKTSDDDSTKSIELAKLPRGASQGGSTVTLLQSTDPGDVLADERDQAAHAATWSPLWLKQNVIGIFLLAFIGFTVALPILLAYSQKPSGLGQAEMSATDVWRFAPTAVLTIITIFWTRVELQALRYMPWVIARDRPHDSEWMDLDYTSMIPPVLLFRSLRNRHMLVFFSALAAILLRVQVVLSTNLFKISLRGVPEPIQVRLLDSFDTIIDEPVSLISMDAYYNAIAAREYQMNLPFGVARAAAYQTFNTEEPMRDPVTVTVDGLFTRVECKLLTNYTNPPRKVNPDYGKPNQKSFHYMLDLQFDGCPSPIAVRSPFLNWVGEDLGDTNFWFLEPMERNITRCPSLPPENEHFVYLTGHWSANPEDKSLPRLDNLAAVLCAPRATTSKVQVVADTTSQNLTVLENKGEPAIVNIDPWPFLEWSIPKNSKRWVGLPRPDHRWDDMLPGPYMASYDLQGEPDIPDANGSDTSVYNSRNLYQSIWNITSELGSLVAHYQLKTNASDVVEASVERKRTILHVDKGIGIAMTILFACCTSITLFIGTRSKSVFGAWHRDPATLLGSMAFFQEMGDYATETQAKKDESRKALWAEGSFSPMILRPWYRVLFVVYGLVLIIVLNATHQMSTASNGIATIGSSPSISFLWTFIPALAMFVVALHANATDNAVRSLSTILALSRRSCTGEELDLYFLDMLGIKALYYSLRSRIFSVTLSQSIAIICAFLTTISTLLFTPNPTSHFYTTDFEQRTWFSSAPHKDTLDDDLSLNRLSISALVTINKQNNFTYPPWTYEDMVFPELAIDNSNRFWGSNTIVKAQMPAARLAADCREVPKDELKIGTKRVESYDQNDKLQAGVKVTINQTLVCPNEDSGEVSDVSSTPSRNLPLIPGVFPFARVLQSLYCEKKPAYSPWDVITYAWGSFSEDSMSFDHLSVHRCNYSWVEVPTNVSLIRVNGSIHFDNSDPPITVGDEKPWSSPFEMPDLGRSANASFTESRSGPSKYTSVWPVLSVSSAQVLELQSQFNVILQPYGTLTSNDLGNPEKATEVLAEVTSVHRIAAAQLVHKENRLSINQNSTVPPFHHGELLPIQATIFRSGAMRLFQSEPATLALTLILSITVSVHIWALAYTLFRYLFRGRIPLFPWDVDLKGLAPYRFNSVAMVSSLLEGSNYIKILPKRAYQMYPPELHEYFSGTFFRLGWFVRQEEEERVFTVGVMDDKKFYFSGSDETRESVHSENQTTRRQSQEEGLPLDSGVR